MSNKLTQELIAQVTKNERLSTITNLNIWGRDIDDISIISQMPALQNVGLSVNKITTLKDFANLQNLTQLALKNNLISDLKEISYLTSCPNLKTLWLSKNPIAEYPSYRQVVIAAIPSLSKLDDIPITDSEREQAEHEVFYYGEHKHKGQSNQYDYHYKQQYGGDGYMKRRSDRQNGYYMDYPHHEEQYYVHSREQEQRPRRLNSSDKRQGNVYSSDPYSQHHNMIAMQEQQRQQGLFNRMSDQYDMANYHQRNIPDSYRNIKHNERRKSRGHEDKKNTNVMKCLLMLLDELNSNELQYVQDEIEKKISSI